MSLSGGLSCLYEVGYQVCMTWVIMSVWGGLTCLYEVGYHVCIR